MSQFPPVLENLLSADAPAGDAWADFAREYTRLLLHVAIRSSRGRDEAMDVYAYLLERLSENGYQRLRAYAVNPNSKFTTWLVVVARRICIDHHRMRYGRIADSASGRERDQRDRRRRLEDLVERLKDAEDVADENTLTPDCELEAAELTEELTWAVSLLAPGDRLLIRMRFEDGRSAAEIATALGYPSQFHVYRRLKIILASLRESLRSRGFESAAS